MPATVAPHRSERVPAISEDVVIERRFRGPPDSANGGYACGLLAAHLDPGLDEHGNALATSEATRIELRDRPPA